MTDPIEIMHGDTGVALSGQCNAAGSSLPDLTGATVTLKIMNVLTGATVLDDLPVTITDAPTRMVKHEFTDADFTVLVPGKYRYRWKVTRSGKKISVPNTQKYFLTLIVNAA